MEKLYKKIIDGVEIIKHRNQIVIKAGDFNFYNPSEEMLFEDGWEEYKIEVNEEDVIIPEPQITLHDVKENKIAELLKYDSSPAVNEFSYHSYPMWLDKSTRSGLMLRVNAELINEQYTTTLWYNNVSFTLATEAVQKMLYMLELYASECYDNTQMHMANILKLNDIDAVLSYDFTTGYPKKLSF